MSGQENTRILIVEDDYVVSEMIRGLSEQIGYTVVGEAANGNEAIEATQSLRPDVVIMDIRMPDMDGIEAARRIQERCPTPVVVLTAYETPELVEQAAEAGVGAYLTKPPIARDVERAITIATARFRDMMELRRLNEDLEARNEELDAYAHTVAHDLQNPLSLLIGYSEALLKYRETMSEEELEGCLRTLEQTGRSMSRTVDQLLLLGRARTMEVEMKPLDMASIVTEAQRHLAHMIDTYQAEITVPNNWPIALGHGPWIEEVWVNYLTNAIKYGGRPPHLELGATMNPDGTVRFWVRDNGPGIKPEEQVRLFDPFTRPNQTRVKGNGLGLSIVRRIVQQLGGEVGVESETDKGSVFSFTLPSATGQGEP
jgi:signal transduction histidine kinase